MCVQDVLKSGRDLRRVLDAIGEIDLTAPSRPFAYELCHDRISGIIGGEMLGKLLAALTPEDDDPFGWSALAARSVIEGIEDLMAVLLGLLHQFPNLPVCSSCPVILNQCPKVVCDLSTIIESTKFIRYRVHYWQSTQSPCISYRYGGHGVITAIGVDDTEKVYELLMDVAAEVKTRASAGAGGGSGGSKTRAYPGSGCSCGCRKITANTVAAAAAKQLLQSSEANRVDYVAKEQTSFSAAVRLRMTSPIQTTTGVVQSSRGNVENTFLDPDTNLTEQDSESEAPDLWIHGELCTGDDFGILTVSIPILTVHMAIWTRLNNDYIRDTQMGPCKYLHRLLLHYAKKAQRLSERSVTPATYLSFQPSVPSVAVCAPG
ncbi:hypothetical protein EJB05_17447 [Eragrostis curvula]|uniref:Uncharacterized protein n=1 Tax=Eragrostis curvula TaxID=38414 RepID=A0A5J9VJ11_9POAL|nr:hypothetical protein EJB05_17447 [Eragrostis curvula]